LRCCYSQEDSDPPELEILILSGIISVVPIILIAGTIAADFIVKQYEKVAGKMEIKFPWWK